jgi:hypothetical protein
MITQKIISLDDKRSTTWICSSFPTMIYFIDQSYIKPLEKTSVPDRSTFEIKHYIIRDEVQKGESGSPIHISTDEQISRHFDKASVQDERVCVLKLELVETTFLLKKEEMTPKLGGSTNVLLIDGYDEKILSNSESGLKFLTNRHFPVWKMVQTADVP